MSKVDYLEFRVESLRALDSQWLEEALQSEDCAYNWEEDALILNSLGIPDDSGGVNPGDQRALYYLIRTLKPGRILEVGTHIGSSTLSIAMAAMRNISDGVSTRITTLDIRDVNCETKKPWLAANSPASPATLLKSVGSAEIVDFQVGLAAEWFEGVGESRFDFIFLDGDHSSKGVYREVSLALKRLNHGGVILMHDLFPDGKPLWKRQPALQGPWLAIERIISEEPRLRFLPLGELPWPTKHSGNTTSLALLASASTTP